MASKKVVFTEKQYAAAWEYVRAVCSAGNLNVPFWGDDDELDTMRRTFVDVLLNGVPTQPKSVKLSDGSRIVRRKDGVYRLKSRFSRFDVMGARP